VSELRVLAVLRLNATLIFSFIIIIIIIACGCSNVNYSVAVMAPTCARCWSG